MRHAYPLPPAQGRRVMWGSSCDPTPEGARQAGVYPLKSRHVPCMRSMFVPISARLEKDRSQTVGGASQKHSRRTPQTERGRAMPDQRANRSDCPRRGAAQDLTELTNLSSTSLCIKCYQCNSQSDQACRDPFQKTSKSVDCNTQDSYNYNNNFLKFLLNQEDNKNLNLVGATRFCHKIITSTGTVIRTCLDSNPVNKNQSCQLLDSASLIDPSKKISHCSVCDTDNCNGVGAISSSLPLAAVTVIISYLVYKQ
ncbi:unnamed protein product [Diatraea saccharalis]|uniref:Protein sleepless n=1 Tax=Diatraea saccharalis TaxID=40085 RepID=A0A9N9R3N3_9NEOP|nr:unnamed protein product [Diatraea saccharalis]